MQWLLGLCGFVTSVLTAVILWWIEAATGFALYSLTFWFVLPVGAFFAGWGAAAGYGLGAWTFGQRPTKLLLLNMVVTSLTTFFLVHYFSYLTLEIGGRFVSEVITFPTYLDLSIRSTSMRLLRGGSTGGLDGWGYLVAVLQVGGFMLGGLGVYGWLDEHPYCETCSRYLRAKGKRIRRYTGDAEGLQAVTAQIHADLRAGALASAVEHQKTFGDQAEEPLTHHLRSIVEVRHCKRCRKHWIKFSVARRKGNDWKDIPDVQVSGFTHQVIHV